MTTRLLATTDAFAHKSAHYQRGFDLEGSDGFATSCSESLAYVRNVAGNECGEPYPRHSQ